MWPVIGSFTSIFVSFGLMNTGSSVDTVVESLMIKKSSTASCGDLSEFLGCEFKASWVSSGVRLSFSLIFELLSMSKEEQRGPDKNISLSSDLSITWNSLRSLLLTLGQSPAGPIYVSA